MMPTQQTNCICRRVPRDRPESDCPIHGTATPLAQALAAGWVPVPDCRAADPSDRPAAAVALYASGPRLAWLLETDNGYVLDADGSLGRQGQAQGKRFTHGEAVELFMGLDDATFSRAERLVDAFVVMHEQEQSS